MVIRIRKEMPTRYIFQAGAAIVGLVVVGAILRDMVLPPRMAPCSERYTRALLFPLADKSGKPLQTSDLQSTLAGGEWGLMENATIVATADATAPTALQIALKTSGVKPGTEGTPGGAGFTWQADHLPDLDRTCLAYSVWVPADFNYGKGGALPGLVGGDPTAAANEGLRPFFNLTLRWREDGRIELRRVTADAPQGATMTIAGGAVRLQKGAWTSFELEVVLNTPGKADGGLRLWVDETLSAEKQAMQLRRDADVGFRYVKADVHYAATDLNWQPAPADGQIRLSPLLISMP